MSLNIESIQSVFHRLITMAQQLDAASVYTNPKEAMTSLALSCHQDDIKTIFNQLATALNLAVANNSEIIQQIITDTPEFSNAIVDSLIDLQVLGEYFMTKRHHGYSCGEIPNLAMSACSEVFATELVSQGHDSHQALLRRVDHLRELITGIVELHGKYSQIKSELNLLFRNIDPLFLCHLTRHHVNRREQMKSTVGGNDDMCMIVDQSHGTGRNAVCALTDGDKRVGKLCPLCNKYVKVSSKGSWKAHIMKELQAYICVSPTGKDHAECSKAFDTCQEWYEHELKYHANYYTCNHADCVHHATNRDDMARHFAAQHDSLTGLALERGLNKSRQYDEMPLTRMCPLCQKTVSLDVDSGVEMFNSHVADHLEQLALLAAVQLGNMQDDGHDDDDGSPEIPATSPMHSVGNTHEGTLPAGERPCDSRPSHLQKMRESTHRFGRSLLCRGKRYLFSAVHHGTGKHNGLVGSISTDMQTQSRETLRLLTPEKPSLKETVKALFGNIDGYRLRKWRGGRGFTAGSKPVGKRAAPGQLLNQCHRFEAPSFLEKTEDSCKEVPYRKSTEIQAAPLLIAIGSLVRQDSVAEVEYQEPSSSGIEVPVASLDFNQEQTLHVIHMSYQETDEDIKEEEFPLDSRPVTPSTLSESSVVAWWPMSMSEEPAFTSSVFESYPEESASSKESMPLRDEIMATKQLRPLFSKDAVGAILRFYGADIGIATSEHIDDERNDTVALEGPCQLPMTAAPHVDLAGSLADAVIGRKKLGFRSMLPSPRNSRLSPDKKAKRLK